MTPDTQDSEAAVNHNDRQGEDVTFFSEVSVTWQQEWTLENEDEQDHQLGHSKEEPGLHFTPWQNDGLQTNRNTAVNGVSSIMLSSLSHDGVDRENMDLASQNADLNGVANSASADDASLEDVDDDDSIYDGNKTYGEKDEDESSRLEKIRQDLAAKASVLRRERIRQRADHQLDHLNKEEDSSAQDTSIAQLLRRFRQGDPADRKDRSNVESLFWWSRGNEDGTPRQRESPRTLDHYFQSTKMPANSKTSSEPPGVSLGSPIRQTLQHENNIHAKSLSHVKDKDSLVDVNKHGRSLNKTSSRGRRLHDVSNSSGEDESDFLNRSMEIATQTQTNVVESAVMTSPSLLQSPQSFLNGTRREKLIQTTRPKRVRVLWDIENVQVPHNLPTFEVARALHQKSTDLALDLWGDDAASMIGGPQCRVYCFHDPFKRTLNLVERKELVSAFVTLVDIGKDKAGMADLLIVQELNMIMQDFAASEVLIVLVSSDTDFVPAIQNAALQGYNIACIGSFRDSKSTAFRVYREFAWKLLDWHSIIADVEQRSPVKGQVKSEPRGKPPRPGNGHKKSRSNSNRSSSSQPNESRRRSGSTASAEQNKSKPSVNGQLQGSVQTTSNGVETPSKGEKTHNLPLAQSQLNLDIHKQNSVKTNTKGSPTGAEHVISMSTNTDRTACTEEPTSEKSAPERLSPKRKTDQVILGGEHQHPNPTTPRCQPNKPIMPLSENLQAPDNSVDVGKSDHSKADKSTEAQGKKIQHIEVNTDQSTPNNEERVRKESVLQLRSELIKRLQLSEPRPSTSSRYASISTAPKALTPGPSSKGSLWLPTREERVAEDAVFAQIRSLQQRIEQELAGIKALRD